MNKPITLKPVNLDWNHFCGPAIVSAITGLATSVCAKHIRNQTGNRCAKGVPIWALVKTFKALGYNLDDYHCQFLRGYGKQFEVATDSEQKEIKRFNHYFLRQKMIQQKEAGSIDPLLREMFQPESLPFQKLPRTFRQFVKETAGWRSDDIYLCVAGRHYRAIQGWNYVCGQTNEIVGFSQAPKMGSRMNWFARISRTPGHTQVGVA